MRAVAGLKLLVAAAAVTLIAGPVEARPGHAGGPGVRAAPGQIGQHRPVGRPGAVRHHRGRFAGHGIGPLGFGHPGESTRIVVVRPAAREMPRERSIPVAIGIPRPPQADPVLLRLENEKGRRFVRMIRIGAYGAQTTVVRR